MNRIWLWKRVALIVALMMVASLVLAACGDDDDPTATTGAAPAATNTPGSGAEPTSTNGGEVNLGDLTGRVNIDGSSTVFPVTQAMAEEFQLAAGGVQVPVGVSGTGGGFAKFCAGETDISNASRPIGEEEAALCEENGIEYIEIPVAFDGLSVMVNPANDWAECLTVSQLATMWEPAAEGQIMSWNQIDESFPDEDLILYGPGTDSGTYDYFTGVITGEEGASRGDFTGSEDDNILVQGIAGNANAIGFFGFAYYVENQDILKLVAVDNEDGVGCVEPSAESIEDGSYQPLSRPVFIYVSTAAYERPEVNAFVDFYLSEGPNIIPEIGYIPFSVEIYSALYERFVSGRTGSVFEGGGSTEGVTVNDLLFEDER
ncbi:MAG TPA: PstS family phosphate ABC transporter substrate-binding protein [Thermomicrobiales bacterium]|nr:PstS family phosphate ABC transporter substrate-binding protein [Thermomicrobiales bacterium]